MKAVIRSIKNEINKYDEGEKLVRELTSNDDIEPSTQNLMKLTIMLKDQNQFPTIIQMLFKRLKDYNNIRHVEKSLMCIYYLLQHADKKFFRYCMKDKKSIEKLRKYRNIINNVDNGRVIRSRANRIIALLDSMNRKHKKPKKRADRTLNKKKPTTTVSLQPVEPLKSKHDASHFIGHISLDDARKLRVNDKIDHRDRKSGKFVAATITKIDGTNCRICYEGYQYQDDWSDFREETYRFAIKGYISQRSPHRFKQMKIGDYVDINPFEKHPGWKCGKIVALDHFDYDQFGPLRSGQVQVEYQCNGIHLYWTHLDNDNEIAYYKTKVQGTDNKQRKKKKDKKKKSKHNDNETDIYTKIKDVNTNKQLIGGSNDNNDWFKQEDDGNKWDVDDFDGWTDDPWEQNEDEFAWANFSDNDDDKNNDEQTTFDFMSDNDDFFQQNSGFEDAFQNDWDNDFGNDEDVKSREQIYEALLAMGYNATDIGDALNNVVDDINKNGINSIIEYIENKKYFDNKDDPFADLVNDENDDDIKPSVTSTLSHLTDNPYTANNQYFANNMNNTSNNDIIINPQITNSDKPSDGNNKGNKEIEIAAIPKEQLNNMINEIKENHHETSYHPNDSKESVKKQLLTFGYNESDINDALNNIANSKDINSIIEYINNKQKQKDPFYDLVDDMKQSYNDNDKNSNNYAVSPNKNVAFGYFEKDDMNKSNIDTKIKQNNDDEKKEENERNNITMSGPTEQFYNFLKQNRLQQYFDKFKENECCDIRDIEYLMEDDDFLKNDIGIKSPIHRRKLIGECKKLKDEMDEFKTSNLIPSIILNKLKTFGVVTMNILCQEIENESDIKNKFNINNDKQRELLWNIIKIQSQPQINQFNEYNDGIDQPEGVNNNNNNNNNNNYGDVFNHVMDTAR